MLAQSLLSSHVDPIQFSDRPIPISIFNHHDYLYQEVLEHLTDGILVLTETGQLIYSNSIARKICACLNPDAADFNVPEGIWQVLQQLTNNYRNSPVQPTFLTYEVRISRSIMLRLRVQWLKLSGEDNYLLVSLEDFQQANRDQATVEVKQYELTAREAEVWLLRRAGYSYREIAEQLYLAVNTVKQHLKHIYTKQKAYLNVVG